METSPSSPTGSTEQPLKQLLATRKNLVRQQTAQGRSTLRERLQQCRSETQYDGAPVEGVMRETFSHTPQYYEDRQYTQRHEDDGAYEEVRLFSLLFPSVDF